MSKLEIHLQIGKIEVLKQVEDKIELLVDERTWEKDKNLTFCEVRPTGRLMMIWRGLEKSQENDFLNGALLS